MKRKMTESHPSPLLASFELPEIVFNPTLRQQTAIVLENNPSLTTTMQHYTYVTLTIQRLEQEIRHHLQEQHDIFTHLADDQRFQTLLQPVVRRYRQPPETRRHHPYTRTPSPITIPIITATTPSENLPTSSSDSSNQPSSYYFTAEEEGTPEHPIEINDDEEHLSSPDPNNIPIPLGEPSLGTTTTTPPHGTPLNPIIVDSLPPSEPEQIDTPIVERGTLLRSGTRTIIICSKCTCSGHSSNECIFRRPHTCDLCHRTGHVRGNCPQRVVCYNCRRPDHYRSECPEPRR